MIKSMIKISLIRLSLVLLVFYQIFIDCLLCTRHYNWTKKWIGRDRYPWGAYSFVDYIYIYICYGRSCDEVVLNKWNTRRIQCMWENGMNLKRQDRANLGICLLNIWDLLLWVKGNFHLIWSRGVTWSYL